MCAKGLAKLIEECGELQQVAGKKLAYYHTDEHPDSYRAGPLSVRLVEEMGDVMAAITFAAHRLGIDHAAIMARCEAKLRRFEEWDAQPDNNAQAIDR
jgi:NTP pyrophosphatase (non-canonical NTP hydrolase)